MELPQALVSSAPLQRHDCSHLPTATWTHLTQPCADKVNLFPSKVEGKFMGTFQFPCHVIYEEGAVFEVIWTVCTEFSHANQMRCRVFERLHSPLSSYLACQPSVEVPLHMWRHGKCNYYLIIRTPPLQWWPQSWDTPSREEKPLAPFLPITGHLWKLARLSKHLESEAHLLHSQIVCAQLCAFKKCFWAFMPF